MEISFGSEKAPEIESGDTIKGETPVDFSDAALAAMNQTKTAATAFAEDADALKQNFLLRGFFKQRGYEDPSELKKEQDFSTAVAAQQQGICVRRQGHFRQIRQCETQE